MFGENPVTPSIASASTISHIEQIQEGFRTDQPGPRQHEFFNTGTKKRKAPSTPRPPPLEPPPVGTFKVGDKIWNRGGKKRGLIGKYYEISALNGKHFYICKDLQYPENPHEKLKWSSIEKIHPNPPPIIT